MMFKKGDKLKVSPSHGFFFNMSDTWVYEGLRDPARLRGLHVIRNPETGESFRGLLEVTLETHFKLAAPIQLENK